MTIEDETKEKDTSKADVKETVKKGNKAPTGPATIRKTYTYECLLAYRHSPIVKLRPECLAEEHCNEEGTWDPELWHASLSGKKSRSASPAVGLELKLNRKLSDAKERIKQEQDGIILSPQRRSFNHGCQITFPQPSSLASERPRPKSPQDKDSRDGRDAVNGRSNQVRRRVITRPSRETLMEKERERQREREAENGIYEEREQYDRYSRRGNYDRQQNRRRKDEQPEWFVDAPTSQLETIELHGFGEEEEAERDEVNWERKKAREANEEKTDELSELVQSLQDVKEDHPTSTPPNKDFDINEFFNFTDPVSIAPTSEEENHGLAQSRFSHLFASSGPVVDGLSNSLSSSRRSSLQKDELDFLQELRNNSGSDTDTGSTPNQALINDVPESTPFTLLEMLQKTTGEGSIDVENDMRKREVKQKLIEGQAKSLAEIEAGMKKDLSHVRRRSSPGAVTAMARGGSPAVQGSEDQTAFNNFLASIGQTKSPEKAGFNEVTAPLSGSMSPDVVSSSHGPGTLAGPFQNGPHDPLHDVFNDPEVRVPSQSPEVAYVNDLPFRSDPLELRQNENRVPSPLNKGMLLDILKMSAAPSVPPSVEPVSYLQSQSPQTQEQVANLLQQSLMNNHRHQANPEMVSNLVKQAAATNPALVASIISQGMAPAADVSGMGQQRSVSPQERYQHALLQQQAAQRGRSPLLTSPLAFGGSPSPLAPSPHPGGITPPIGTTSQHLIPPPPMGVAIPPGAHQPSPIRPRIPSPQELVKHTQNILQQALIKRQLEVQREKFYARERETRNKSPVPSTPLQQGQRRLASGRRTPPVTPSSKPSPVLTTAFTPTSVIRKMHESKAEAKAAETKHSGTIEKQLIPERQSTATASSNIPQTPGSPSHHKVAGETTPIQGEASSKARSADDGHPGPPVSHSGGQPSALHIGQSNHGLPGSPRVMELGRGDATEAGRENVTHNQLQTNDTKVMNNANTGTKMMMANGDMAGMRNQFNHAPGLQQPLSGNNPYIPTKPEFMNRDVEPGLEQHMIHNQTRPGAIPGQQYPAGLPPDQLRPMMRLPNQPQQPQQQQQHRAQHASHVMQPRAPPLNPQFPLIHPNQRMMMGAPVGIPMAQQNIMRGMMFPTNVPPPRPPTVTGVNPMAMLAMQQLNQRAALSQMQIPAQSATSPTQGGLTRGMLPPQFPAQQAMHHPAAMGVPMVQQRNMSPAQLGQTPRTPLTQQGMPNDMTVSMEHQRNMMYSLPTPSTSTNTPSATSPDSGSNPLAKWFGNDILKQSLNSSRPAVPEGLKVLSVEELERQQQVVN